jgi:hypothetical protein
MSLIRFTTTHDLFDLSRGQDDIGQNPRTIRRWFSYQTSNLKHLRMQ